MRRATCSMPQSYEEFHVHSEKSASLVDKTPWSAFCTLGDFEFAEIALASLLNQQQNDAKLHKACDAAVMELTLFSRVEVRVPYKNEECMFEAHIRPLWEWALDILENPFLGLHFTWDAQRLYRHNGIEYERFYDEPWTGDYWWDIQSSLPDIKNAMPFGLILYADKSNLLSFSTAKSYPIIVCCANLPVEIRNSNVIGGVPEDAEEEGKLGYTTLKHVIWHESFKKLLLEIEQYSKTGTFEPRMHAQGIYALCVCATNQVEGDELLKWLGLQLIENVFWMIGFSDLHLTCSFDQLHYGHGFWGKHVFGDLKIKANVKKYFDNDSVASFPHWQNLTHFNQVIHVTFSDGNKLADISKQIFYTVINVLKKSITPEGLIGLDVQTECTINMINDKILTFDQTLKDYTKCVMKSNIDGLRTDWNFPKVHLWKHVI
ncbi:hypothetical protein BKA82DRAFT_4018741 [Pisolithus tinctorius]|nr:hypothetical protein BKA82DRAFT_4018741 [Pisolithus tinctorius]